MISLKSNYTSVKGISPGPNKEIILLRKGFKSELYQRNLFDGRRCRNICVLPLTMIGLKGRKSTTDYSSVLCSCRGTQGVEHAEPLNARGHCGQGGAVSSPGVSSEESPAPWQSPHSAAATPVPTTAAFP